MSAKDNDASRDMLDMDYINSLPQPLWSQVSGIWWPVNDIEVRTGLYRIDVCGLLQVEHIDSAMRFRDDGGKEHDPADFFVGAERDATT